MKVFISAVILCFYTGLFAQIQSPSEFLGYKLGTQFTRHANVVAYFQYIADNSSRATFGNYGSTYEKRPLSYAIVSSEENIKNLEAIRTDNLKQIGLVGTNNNC